MADKSQEESEAPAKVYQIDALATQLSNIEQLIKSQNKTYVTKDELKLSQQVQDAEIKTLRDKLKNWTKAAWIIGSTVIALVVNQLWQVFINSGRVQ